MNLESIDEVTKLRNYRRNALKLIEAAGSGPIRLKIGYEQDDIEVFSHVSPDQVRQSVIRAATDFVVDIEKQLAKLGVRVTDPTPAEEPDAKALEDQIDMYSRAWIRELGGALIPKTHLIDALVLTTRQLKADVDKAARKDERKRLADLARQMEATARMEEQKALDRHRGVAACEHAGFARCARDFYKELTGGDLVEAKPPSILIVDGEVTPERLADIRERFRKEHVGAPSPTESGAGS